MKLIKVKRKDSTAHIEPEKIKERKSKGTKYVCKDGKCNTHVILFITPTKVEHHCPPGSSKTKPLVAET